MGYKPTSYQILTRFNGRSFALLRMTGEFSAISRQALYIWKDMYEKAEKGCLVIHGLTGSPATMRPLIDALIRAGFRVNAPLLPGHGTSLEDLARVAWGQWWGAVLDAYHDLRREAKKVSCVGLSLGGLLALRLAIEMRWAVRALVVMGTPLILNNVIEYLAWPLVKYTPLRWFYRFSSKDWSGSVADPEGREIYRRHSYDKISVHSVFELFKLKKLVRGRLGEITTPVLVLHGKGDKVAPVGNVELIKSALNSNMIEVMMLNRSRHVLTLDYDKEIAAQAVVAFLDRFS